MKRAKKYNALYKYLAPLLEHGSDEEIDRARTQYRKEYKRKWLQQKRAKEKHYTISFTSAEHQILSKALMTCKRSATQLIKHACLAQLQQQHVATDGRLLQEVKGELERNYALMQKLCEAEQIHYKQGEHILSIIEKIEQHIAQHFYAPHG